MNLGKLIIDIGGPELTQEDKDILKHPNIGGVILFSRNYISIDQVSKLINDIKNLRSPSLIIYVDQEGGRVQRFKEGLTIIPSIELLGEKYNSDPDDAIDIFLMGAGNDLRFYNIEELFHAAQLLHYFKDFVNEFGYNTEFENDPLMTGEVWLAPVYGFQFNEMIKKNKNLGFIYPKNTKIWRDNVAINSDSRNKQIALKFLNHLMNPKNSALNFKHNLYKPLNNEAFKYIPDDLKSNQYIYPDSNNLKLITDEIEDRYIRNKKHYFYYRISGLNGERNEITD